MWVGNEAPKDQALSKNYDNYIQYEMADIQDGVYKPGWKRLFGTVEGTTETGLQLHRYSTTAENGEALFYPELTYGWEGKVKLGNKNVTLAFIKWDYAVCVFVKE